MEKIPERLFQINGYDSWVHCMRINGAQSIGAEHNYHYHEYVELLLFLQGNATLIVNEENYLCQPFQLAVINPGEPHDVLFNAQSQYICVKFLPQILYDGYSNISEFPYALPYLLESHHSRVFQADWTDGQLLSQVMEEWESRRLGCELVIRANILKIYTAIMRIWQQEGAYSVSAGVPSYIHKALEHISCHFAHTNEKQTAALCGVTYHHFSTAFRQALGKPFSQYLTEIRIREAKKRLATTNQSVEQIADEVGFATASHFIHRFRCITGFTPIQYRKQLRN